MTTHVEHPGPRDFEEAPHVVSPRARRWALIACVLLVLLAVLAVLGLYLRQRWLVAHQHAALVDERAKGLRVVVTQVSSTPGQRVVTRPGDVYAYYQATLFAKVSGYVKEVRVQRGQRVKKNEVLAIIDSPETAKDVATAQHDETIARINATRANRLTPSGVVAVQDRDNAIATYRVSESQLERAQVILGYTAVRAPFDGVISARYVDPGALLPANGATTGSLPVVDVSDVDRVRVFVYLGQDAAPFVHEGDETTIWQDELPQRRIPAKVTYTTGALDPRTRTMQVEIDLDNRQWHLLPGTFAHADVKIAEPPQPLVPDEAIVVRDGKPLVVTVVDGRAHYVPVELGFNDGRKVRILRGLAGGETVALDVPIQVLDGDPVQAVPRDEGKEGGHR